MSSIGGLIVGRRKIKYLERNFKRKKNPHMDELEKWVGTMYFGQTWLRIGYCNTFL